MTDRELDARIAVEFFGWRWHLLPSGTLAIISPLSVASVEVEGGGKEMFCEPQPGGEAGRSGIPNCSTDMNVAMRVVAAIKANGDKAVEEFMDALCDMGDRYGFLAIRGRSLEWLLLHCPNPARAICEAALEAVAEAKNV